MADPEEAREGKEQRSAQRQDPRPDAPPITPYPEAEKMADPDAENQRYRPVADRDDITTPDEENPPPP